LFKRVYFFDFYDVYDIVDSFAVKAAKVFENMQLGKSYKVDVRRLKQPFK